MRNLILVLALLGISVLSCSTQPGLPRNGSSSEGDEILRRAFQQHSRNLQVEGRSLVERILPDDLEGSRHQRFILQLGSGQTLLVTHNIDVAPRIPDLREGDEVEFRGVYEWNPEGGVIHWTHHDPAGRHPGGWLKHKGTTYQ